MRVLGVLCGSFENETKPAFTFSKRPIRLAVVAEDHVLDYSFRHTQGLCHESVHVDAFGAEIFLGLFVENICICCGELERFVLFRKRENLRDVELSVLRVCQPMKSESVSDMLRGEYNGFYDDRNEEKLNSGEHDSPEFHFRVSDVPT